MSQRKILIKSKWLIRQIAILLILSIVVNLLHFGLAPQKAKAVDVNDHMLLFWPSDATCTSPSPPTNWTAVSDGAGEDFTAYFPRGGANYSAKNAGSNNHTHAPTITTPSMSSVSVRKSGTAGITGSSATHTMTVNTASVDTQNTLPKYKELCVIRYDNGIPNGNSAIPNSAVAIFDAAPPAGWSDYSATFSAASDTFIRGGTNGTGGNNTHGGVTHAMTSIQLTTPSGTATSASSTRTYAPTTHTHTVANQTSDTPDIQPPYMNIYLGQKSTAGAIPNGMIAMFDDADGSVGFSVAGWTRLSDASGPFDGKFLKVTGSYNSPGGSAQHHHADINTTSAAYTAPAGTATNGASGPAYDHVHDVTLAWGDGTNTNIPPYTSVVIAKKQTVVTTLSTDKGNYGLGETISVSTTVTNYHASSALNDKYIDAVIFEDTVTADGKPTTNETYITNGCAGSGAWASGNYTHQNNNVDTAAGSGTANDNWNCSNASFPDTATYTLWVRWYDSTSYAYNIYYEKSVTFTSVPTLSEILFLALVGCAVFLAVRRGAVKLSRPKTPSGDDSGPIPPNNNYQQPVQNHQKGESPDPAAHAQDSGFRASPPRSIDGLHHDQKKLPPVNK